MTITELENLRARIAANAFNPIGDHDDFSVDVVKLLAIVAKMPLCEECKERQAACLGCYEDHAQEGCTRDECSQHDQSYACDECCAHGNEDG